MGEKEVTQLNEESNYSKEEKGRNQLTERKGQIARAKRHIMATVNFITFNQDHSCLAVGQLLSLLQQLEHTSKQELISCLPQEHLEDSEYITQTRSRNATKAKMGTSPWLRCSSPHPS